MRYINKQFTQKKSKLEDNKHTVLFALRDVVQILIRYLFKILTTLIISHNFTI